MSIKSLLSKITGIDKVKEELETELLQAKSLTEQARIELESTKIELESVKVETEKAIHDKETAVISEKDKATARGEPWVSVIQTHLNPDDPRNGFFELDWNNFFIENLIHHGYGYEDDPPEEIVDRWFRDLAGNVLAEHEMPKGNTTAGYVDFTRLSDEHVEAK